LPSRLITVTIFLVLGDDHDFFAHHEEAVAAIPQFSREAKFIFLWTVPGFGQPQHDCHKPDKAPTHASPTVRAALSNCSKHKQRGAR